MYGNGDSYDKAVEEWEQGNLKKAFELFLDNARKGDEYSQNNLGIFYESGFGTSKNTTKALEWYKKSARQNNSAAIFNIADLYRKMNKKERALYWYNKAVRTNPDDGDARFELAKFYLEIGYSNVSRIKGLLEFAANADNITPSSRETAEKLLNNLMNSRHTIRTS